MKKIFKLLVSASLPTMALCCAPLTSCGNQEKKEEITFENDDWKNVVTLANEGLDALKSHYNVDTFVGLERTVTIYDYQYKVRVIGENEDRLANDSGEPTNTFAALTFQFAQLLSVEYESGDVWPMVIPFTDAQSGEVWKDSLVRSFLNEKKVISPDFTFDLKTSIEDNLGVEGSIKRVSKKSYKSQAFETDFVVSYPEYIFLPSLGDIYSGDQLPSTDKEGYEYEYEANKIDGSYRPYSYFTKNIDPERGSHATQAQALILGDINNHSFPYWLRSAYCDNTSAPIPVWYMNYDGECDECISNPFEEGHALAPIFCI